MKVTTIIAIALAISLVILMSCKTSNKVLSQAQIEELPKVLEYSKSGCRGKCPIFDFTVYEGGHIVFNGKAFTKYEGQATDKLTKEEYAALQANCKKADLWQKQAEYGMNIMDIPTTTLHFYEKDREKKIQWRMRAPQALPDLSNEIVQLLIDRGWIEELKKETGIRMPSGAISNEIIVQFKEETEIKRWCKQYAQYDMQLKRGISKKTFLVNFDTGKMPPDKMLEMVRNNVEVMTAEFNKRMKTRMR